MKVIVKGRRVKEKSYDKQMEELFLGIFGMMFFGLWFLWGVIKNRISKKNK